MPCCTRCDSHRVKPSKLTWHEALHKAGQVVHTGHAMHHVFPALGFVTFLGGLGYAGVNRLAGTCQRCEDCDHVQ